MADILTIPDKAVGDEFTAPEFNQFKAAVNVVNNKAEEVSHDFSGDHFMENGTSTVNGNAVPVIVIRLENIIDTTQLEVVNGKIRIKQSFLDTL